MLISMITIISTTSCSKKNYDYAGIYFTKFSNNKDDIPYQYVKMELCLEANRKFRYTKYIETRDKRGKWIRYTGNGRWYDNDDYILLECDSAKYENKESKLAMQALTGFIVIERTNLHLLKKGKNKLDLHGKKIKRCKIKKRRKINNRR